MGFWSVRERLEAWIYAVRAVLRQLEADRSRLAAAVTSAAPGRLSSSCWRKSASKRSANLRILDQKRARVLTALPDALAADS